MYIDVQQYPSYDKNSVEKLTSNITQRNVRGTIHKLVDCTRLS